MRGRLPRLLSPLILATCLATDAFAAQRVFVASYGSDGSAATGCTLANPCRTFQTALGQVDAGGEVIALDAGGYGRLVIDKSVTVTANPGYFAAVTGFLDFSAITVDGVGIQVVLRGLSLNGSFAGFHGIHMYRGDSLTIENCVIENFKAAGIFIEGPARVRIVNTTVHGNARFGAIGGIVLGVATSTLDNVRMSHNGFQGLFVSGGIASVANSESFGHDVGLAISENGRLSVTGTLVANNAVGISANIPGGYAAVSRSAVVSNGIGLRNNGGTLETYGDNVLRYNTTATEGTITPVSGQ